MIRSTLIAAVAGTAVAAHAGTVTVFELHDHPDANQNPPPYGLRLDGLFGGGVTTFSFDTDEGVFLTVTDDTANSGGITIEIDGRVFGGETSGDVYTDGGAFYDINFVYTASVVETATGWRVAGIHNTANTGTITEVGGPSNADAEILTITDNDNNAFLFQADGHRLSGDNDSWVGRGWLTTNSSGTNTDPTQDWIFTATLIPAPGAVALAGFGGLLAARRRRA